MGICLGCRREGIVGKFLILVEKIVEDLVSSGIRFVGAGATKVT